ncbi:chromodomain Y-like protein [Spodoptera frugiperda]|uniref:Chromodomain Y-like protein n=1 Tax=Spodoptera frugiperda TaxID=7108 RepID=A0A9R0DKR2_SPOFR|nr:chromodomain Y-like protein [Spodoptera frugiperda]
MEAVEEPPLHNTTVDNKKVTVVFDENNENAVASVATDVCHKSNGVAESESAEVAAVESNSVPSEDSKCEPESAETSADVNNKTQDIIEEVTEAAVPKIIESTDTNVECSQPTTDDSSPTVEEPAVVKEVVSIAPEEETVVEVDNTAQVCSEGVTFQTEILIETNDNDMTETITEELVVDDQHSNNLLSELGQSIELSEALRSSDVSDSVENNNSSVRQEVFNKEELLDILEGNDEEQSESLNLKNMSSDKILEATIALQQLNRLKNTAKKRGPNERLSRNRRTDKIEKVSQQKQKASVEENIKEIVKGNTEENIVNVLVKEWDDEDLEGEKTNKLLQESEHLLKTTEDVKTQEVVGKEDEQASARTSIDSSSDGKLQVLNKSSDEGAPQRRLGRVIKKKVIFDPDNPDTFTKSKSATKSKEPSMEKDVTPSKKIKTEPTFQRTKSKSPIAKLQWKKPSPKNCKQNKRLTEVDKLLMDEGAVNMIYQLTPEAQKGKKNMKTKAEFIKKLQSSTPVSKEMKFRERKKESKYEEGEAKKILGGKQRSSLNSSVKSPSVCEDFEAHSADDSIIYRRHSSSSYSSSCMSPRRLSDVESHKQTAQADVQNQSAGESTNNQPLADVFMSDVTDAIKPDAINKDDCLSIKEKLNSKLNLALNKRKREIIKGEKPSKIKKLMKTEEKSHVNSEDFKYMSIHFDQRLAEICVQKAGSRCNIEMLKEFEKALQMVEAKKDISVTLLSSECATAFSDLDLRPLLDDSIETSANFAYEMAECVRSLLETLEQHGKLLCAGVNGRCSGVGLALIGLSDVAFASERASFAISPKSHGSVAPIEPGAAAFTTYRLLPQPLLNDLIVFGRRLSASEALQGGLVSRTLWPENFNEQVQTIVKDIASQPARNIWLKKRILNMKKSGSESTFLGYLEKERDLLVEYWTSTEGQNILRATYNA